MAEGQGNEPHEEQDDSMTLVFNQILSHISIFPANQFLLFVVTFAPSTNCFSQLLHIAHFSVNIILFNRSGNWLILMIFKFSIENAAGQYSKESSINALDCLTLH